MADLQGKQFRQIKNMFKTTMRDAYLYIKSQEPRFLQPLRTTAKQIVFSDDDLSLKLRYRDYDLYGVDMFMYIVNPLITGIVAPFLYQQRGGNIIIRIDKDFRFEYKAGKVTLKHKDKSREISVNDFGKLYVLTEAVRNYIPEFV